MPLRFLASREPHLSLGSAGRPAPHETDSARPVVTHLVGIGLPSLQSHQFPYEELPFVHFVADVHVLVVEAPFGLVVEERGVHHYLIAHVDVVRLRIAEHRLHHLKRRPFLSQLIEAFLHIVGTRPQQTILSQNPVVTEPFRGGCEPGLRIPVAVAATQHGVALELGK